MSPETKIKVKQRAKEGGLVITLLTNIWFGYQNNQSSSEILTRITKVETNQDHFKEDVAELKTNINNHKSAIWRAHNDLKTTVLTSINKQK